MIETGCANDTDAVRGAMVAAPTQTNPRIIVRHFGSPQRPAAISDAADTVVVREVRLRSGRDANRIALRAHLLAAGVSNDIEFSGERALLECVLPAVLDSNAHA